MPSLKMFGRRIAVCCMAMLVPVVFGGCTRGRSPADRRVADQPGSKSEDASSNNLQTKTTAADAKAIEQQAALAAAGPKLDQATSQAALSTEQDDMHWTPGGDWTVQRFIVLSAGGPWSIDLAASVAGHSLDHASGELLAQIASDLLMQLEPPRRWEDLLELPAVRSGWLGNLVATQEQRAQLISMYDSQRDDVVSADELPAFLSRGLARAAPLQLHDVGFASDHDPSRSPWGPADRDRDFSIDTQEAQEFARAVSRQDLNADGVLTRQELADAGNGAGADTMMGSGRSSLLQANTLLVSQTWVASRGQPMTSDTLGKEGLRLDTAATLPAVPTDTRQTRKLANDVLQHYTFLSQLSREHWSHWSDQQWQAVDQDANQQIDQGELQQWLSGPSQVQLYVAWPSVHHSAGHADTRVVAPIHVQIHDPAISWRGTQQGGQLVCGSFAIRVELGDVFSGQRRSQLRQQLQQALKEPQLRSMLERRLELNSDAFDLLDRDQDATLSDDEFDQVWCWLTSRNSGRIAGRWMLSAHPWFQLADDNADGRLAERELQIFASNLASFDRNDDASLTPDELPLVATLALSRSDPRFELEIFTPGSATTLAADGDWFSAMDTNRDGSISRSEFLGEKEEFLAMDNDQDGFLSRGDVSFPHTSK